jgi:hypothetical protein
MISLSRLMDKENVVYLHNGNLLDDKMNESLSSVANGYNWRTLF